MADPLLAASRELGIDTSPGDMQFLTAPPRSSATANPMDRLRQQERWRTLQQGSIDRGMALREQMSTFDEQNLRGAERAQRVRDMRFAEEERGREVGRRDEMERQGDELIGAIQRGVDPIEAATASPQGLLDPRVAAAADLQIAEARRERMVRSQENAGLLRSVFDFARESALEAGNPAYQTYARARIRELIDSDVDPADAAPMVESEVQEMMNNDVAITSLLEIGMTDDEIMTHKSELGISPDAPLNRPFAQQILNRWNAPGGAGAKRAELQREGALLAAKEEAAAVAEGRELGQSRVPRTPTISELNDAINDLEGVSGSEGTLEDLKKRRDALLKGAPAGDAFADLMGAAGITPSEILGGVAADAALEND